MNVEIPVVDPYGSLSGVPSVDHTQAHKIVSRTALSSVFTGNPVCVGRSYSPLVAGERCGVAFGTEGAGIEPRGALRPPSDRMVATVLCH
jgi:hypothetical protein